MVKCIRCLNGNRAGIFQFFLAFRKIKDRTENLLTSDMSMIFYACSALTISVSVTFAHHKMSMSNRFTTEKHRLYSELMITSSKTHQPFADWNDLLVQYIRRYGPKSTSPELSGWIERSAQHGQHRIPSIDATFLQKQKIIKPVLVAIAKHGSNSDWRRITVFIFFFFIFFFLFHITLYFFYSYIGFTHITVFCIHCNFRSMSAHKPFIRWFAINAKPNNAKRTNEQQQKRMHQPSPTQMAESETQNYFSLTKK